MARSKKQPVSIPTAHRQGDVLLVRVAALPSLALRVAVRDAGRVVLAYGEVTGHAHAIPAGADLMVADDAAAMAQAARELLASVGLTTEVAERDVVGFLAVAGDTTLAHEEHAAIPLVAGETYVVLRQREWTDANEPRQVAD